MKRRSLSLLSLGHLTVDVTSGALPAVLPFLQREFGLSYLLLAVVATTYQITSSITQPIFGVLSDRGAARILMPLGVLLAAGGFAMLGRAPTYPLMLAAVALSGVGSAIFHPEATKSARYVAGESRAIGMSFFTIGGNLGVALGPLVLTAIVMVGGLRATWIYLIPGVLAAAILAAIMRSIARAETAHRARTSAEVRASDPKAMTLLVCVVALRSVIYGAVLVFVPLYAVNVLHHSPAANGPLLFAILAAGALSTIVGAAIADRAGERKTMVSSFACVPPLIAVYLLAPGIAGVIAIVLVGAFLIGTTTISVIMAHEFMPNRIALASALVIGFTSGVGGIGIALLGKTADVWGLPAALWSLVGVGVAGTILSAMLPEGCRVRPAEDAALKPRNLASAEGLAMK
jgi:FSR family fosmidomycin resistance protein-like MFS transporter